jgi:hypothetical protein
VLESYRLSEQLKQLPDVKIVEETWKTYVAKHPSYELKEDEWEDAYLPTDEEDLAEMNVPRPPLVLDFPLITRRIAAQRSDSSCSERSLIGSPKNSRRRILL